MYRYTKEEEENKKFDTWRYYAIISFICTSVSQCLINKYIDGYYMITYFNRENPTEFCVYIYSHSIFGSHSYIHYDKLVG